MKRSTDRIFVTHVGSLARPADLLKMLNAKLEGEPFDAEALATRLRNAVADVVKEQADYGIDKFYRMPLYRALLAAGDYPNAQKEVRASYEAGVLDRAMIEYRQALEWIR